MLGVLDSSRHDSVIACCSVEISSVDALGLTDAETGEARPGDATYKDSVAGGSA